jgi:hypothetical protein
MDQAYYDYSSNSSAYATYIENNVLPAQSMSGSLSSTTSNGTEAVHFPPLSPVDFSDYSVSSPGPPDPSLIPYYPAYDDNDNQYDNLSNAALSHQTGAIQQDE